MHVLHICTATRSTTLLSGVRLWHLVPPVQYIWKIVVVVRLLKACSGRILVASVQFPVSASFSPHSIKQTALTHCLQLVHKYVERKKPEFVNVDEERLQGE